MNMWNRYHTYQPLYGQSVSDTENGEELYAALPTGECQQEQMWNQPEEFQGEMTNWERRKYGTSHRDAARAAEQEGAWETTRETVQETTREAMQETVQETTQETVQEMASEAEQEGNREDGAATWQQPAANSEAGAWRQPAMNSEAGAWQQPASNSEAGMWQQPAENSALVPGNPALTYDTPVTVAPGEPPLMPGQMEDRTADLEYFEGMYPRRMKEIKIYVNIACDALEYKGSPLYDEYPDRVMIDQLVERIYQKMKADGFGEAIVEEAEPEEVEVYEAAEYIPYGPGPARPPYGPGPSHPPYGPGPARPPYGPGPGRPPYGPGPVRPPYGPGPGRPPQNNWGNDNWLRDIISVLLFQEMFKRRCRYCR